MNDETIVMFLIDQIQVKHNQEIEDLLKPMASGDIDGVDVEALTSTVSRQGLKANENDIRRALMSSHYGGMLSELFKRKATPYVFDPQKFSWAKDAKEGKKEKKAKKGFFRKLFK